MTFHTVGTSLPVKDVQLLRDQADRLNVTMASFLRTILLSVSDKLREKHEPTRSALDRNRRTGLGVMLPDAQAKEIVAIAKARGVTLGVLVRDAVAHYENTVPRTPKE